MQKKSSRLRSRTYLTLDPQTVADLESLAVRNRSNLSREVDRLAQGALFHSGFDCLTANGKT